jgi:hypothetical protein
MFRRCSLIKREYCNIQLFKKFVKHYRPNYKRIGNTCYLSKRCWDTFDKFIEKCEEIEKEYQRQLELSIFRERMYEEKLWKYKW